MCAEADPSTVSEITVLKASSGEQWAWAGTSPYSETTRRARDEKEGSYIGHAVWRVGA